jgi:lipid II:glycine glycyltransferase (peptidoglycan interpeptide bridge formation enzyme)
MEETRERDGFHLHGRAYYEAMIGQKMVLLYFAELDGKVIAASIVTHYGDMATYVHGGSSNDNRDVMAPYLLQWTAILDAQKAELKYYDFYGVDETKWPGVTRFKMGFNPRVYEYPGTHDLVYNQAWYNVYKWLRNLRRKF